MNLATAFAASVEKRPDKIALYWGESEFSYATLSAQSGAVAAELAGKFGVKPGDRVALWVKNCPEFVSAVFGILSAGGVVVPINNFLKPAEVSYIVNDSGANVLITDAELAAHSDTLKAARPSLEILRVEEFPALNPSSESANPPIFVFRERPRGAALHLRHDRPSEGRDAHARQFSPQRGELRGGARRCARTTASWWRCRSFTASCSRWARCCRCCAAAGFCC